MMHDLVSDIQGLGYELTLDGVNLHFQYTGAGDPPERAASLLNELRQHKAEVFAYLRLLHTPQSDLTRPLLIESGSLHDRFYLVADEGQAVEVEGQVCYLPAEVSVLLKNSQAMTDEQVKDYLTKIHKTKKAFPGARVQ